MEGGANTDERRSSIRVLEDPSPQRQDVLEREYPCGYSQHLAQVLIIKPFAACWEEVSPFA